MGKGPFYLHVQNYLANLEIPWEKGLYDITINSENLHFALHFYQYPWDSHYNDVIRNLF